MTEGAVCPDETESAQTEPPQAVRPPIWHRSSWKAVHGFPKQACLAIIGAEFGGHLGNVGYTD